MNGLPWVMPSDFDEQRLDEYCGCVLGFHRFEAEAMMAVIVRFHQARGHQDWLPFSLTDIGDWWAKDPVIRRWSQNPVWRPHPEELFRHGYLTEIARPPNGSPLLVLSEAGLERLSCSPSLSEGILRERRMVEVDRLGAELGKIDGR